MSPTHFSWVAVVITFVLALILELIALPDRLLFLRPEWLVMTVIYWLLRRPDKLGIACGFGTGIVMDVLTGTYFGIHALSMSLICYLVLGMHKRLKMFPVIQQALIVFLITGIQLMIVYMLRLMLSVTDNGLEYLWQALISAAFWPFVVVLYDRIAYTFR